LTLVCKAGWAYLFFTARSRGTPAEMDNAALSIVHGGGMADVFGPGSGPTALIAPIYAYYLGGLHYLFGTGRLAKLALQLGSLTAASAAIAQLPAVARCTRLPVSAGFVAAILMAVSPFAVPHEVNGYWEAAFASLGLLIAFRAVVSLEDAGGTLVVRRAIIVGFLSGLLMLLNPSAIPGVFFAALAGWFQRTGDRLRYTGACLVAVAVCAIVMSPWVYRNYRVFGRWVPVRSNYGLQLYIGNHPAADGRTFGSHNANYTLAVLHPHQNPAELARYEELGDIAYGEEKTVKSMEWIRANPGMFAWLTCQRFRWYWFPGIDLAPDVPSNWFPPRDLLLGTAIWYDVLGAGSFLGASLLLLTRQKFRWHYWALLLGPSLAYMTTHVDPRYRYPNLWVSALLTSYVLVAAYNAIAARIRPNNALAVDGVLVARNDAVNPG
jgi:hypothetical protein